MTPREGRIHPWSRLRWMLAAFGGLLCLVGLTADALGLSGSPGIGLLQLLMIGAGAALALLAWLGRRIVAVYRGTAIVVVNTAILLLLVNVAAALIQRMPRAAEGSAAEISLSDRYAGEPWVEQYAAEYNRVHGRKRYHPFVIWRTIPFRGEMVNVDERGIRRTVGVQCTPGTYLVYALGGSTMWGVGSPDWGTIPSYLAAMLEQRLGAPACVVNFGEHGWVSTQSVVQLVAELDAGRVPDLVVFYDGINDSFTSALLGRAGVHYQLPAVAAKFEGGEDPALALLRGTSLYRLLSRQGRPEGEGLVIEKPDSLARAVVDVYLNNYRHVEALSREYGFAFRFFWQPNLIAGAKPMTPVEAKLTERMSEETKAYLRTVYGLVEEAARTRRNLSYIVDAFHDTTEPVYIDWMHILPAGNRIVAETMVSIIEQDGVLPAKGPVGAHH